MDSKLPWFKFYPSDFMGSGKVSAMSPAECGILMKLLCHSWQEGPLPDDPDKLWRVVGAAPDEMRAAWPVVRACFDVNPEGNLVNRKLERERNSAQGRRQSAKAAAEARHGGGPAPADAIAGPPVGPPAAATPPRERVRAELPFSEAQRPRRLELSTNPPASMGSHSQRARPTRANGAGA